jgi:TrmH family RNA methyltransferase
LFSSLKIRIIFLNDCSIFLRQNQSGTPFPVSIQPDELVLALDGIRDPGNLGTILRIADWFGIHTILASEDTVEVYNPKVVQATMGAIFRVRVHYCDLKSEVERVEFRDASIFSAGGTKYQSAPLMNQSVAKHRCRKVFVYL